MSIVFPDNYTASSFSAKAWKSLVAVTPRTLAYTQCSAALEELVIVNALPFHPQDGMFRQDWTLIGGKFDVYQ